MRRARASWGVVGIVVAAIAGACVGAAEAEGEKVQGWSAELRERFYFTPQGSRMMPYDWFLALETLEGSGSFADAENLARYGFLFADTPVTGLNPDGLPVGFAKDPAVEPGTGHWVGLTCAACHTSEVEVKGRRARIQGAPAALNFDRFYADLADTVAATFHDPARFQRFAAKVLGEDATPEDVARFRGQFAAFQAYLAGDATIRRPVLASGPGRVDALTQIVNSLSVSDQGTPENLRPVEAPTSYPHLWLAPQLEYVQWNPIAASPIGRNAGEVLGVFGGATLRGTDSEKWFTSTALLHELDAMEHWIAELEPPKWADVVGTDIDTTLAEQGRQLFEKNCKGCHNMPPFELTDPAENAFGVSFVKIGCVNYQKVGTDPAYMRSMLARLVRTNEVTAMANGGEPVVPAASYFLKTVGAVLTRGMADAGFSDAEKVALSGYRFRPPAAPGGRPEPYAPISIECLKAGPLVGTWATGPYFHNGSVATVYELLSPPEERRKVFWTGGRELDTERLGFVAENAPGRFRFDTSLPGNGNGGHVFPPTGLSHDERMAIIEYLKIADAPARLPRPARPLGIVSEETTLVPSAYQ